MDGSSDDSSSDEVELLSPDANEYKSKLKLPSPKYLLARCVALKETLSNLPESP